jgi:probable F420-dependent oxidoreductase
MDLRFGASVSTLSSGSEVVAAARSAEAAGFDVLNTSDHLPNSSPFAVLGAAAAVTSRIRLRTYVLDVYFWNSALLARDVATLDALSDGRVELGLGAGHMKHEHDDAGLPFPPLAERAAEVERVLLDVRRRLALPRERAAPVQSPVPLSIGAWGPGTLDVAVRHAEIISLTGMVQIKGAPPGTFALSPEHEVDVRVARLQAALAADRPPHLPAPVLDALLQWVIVDTDPEKAATDLLAEWTKDGGDAGGLTVPDLLAAPFMLLAPTPEAAVEELLRRQARWGISSWCTHTHSVPALAQVVAAYRGRPGPR